MIAFNSQQLLKLADARLAERELEQCREILLRLSPNDRPKRMYEDVTYALAKERLSSGRLEPARELFAECTKAHFVPVIRSLCQERSELLNRLLHRKVASASDAKPLLEAQVKQARRVEAGMLTPEISFVGCPAAYRSGYDPQRIDALSQLIRLMKHGVEESAIERLGQFLAAYVMYGTALLKTIDFVIPVPTQPDRETLRGYSIPKILATQISVMCAVPMHDEFVRTTGRGLELRTLPQWYRKIAVKDAFEIGRRAEWLEGLTGLVVDDVITTGATVREVARLLRHHQVAEVSAVAVAHTEWGGWASI